MPLRGGLRGGDWTDGGKVRPPSAGASVIDHPALQGDSHRGVVFDKGWAGAWLHGAPPHVSPPISFASRAERVAVSRATHILARSASRHDSARPAGASAEHAA